ncbi:hypothetical protein Q2T40_07830 [Winogradskyella maritima]|uniref:Gluconate 2-dehydrogenase subunit 3-like protein n=1 Tax=Winogradskyella maritima TaxID=1517766 RepID=A0ABV8AJP7_9FLAO|nr:hypothetical protein [Winogradskyella maritima]
MKISFIISICILFFGCKDISRTEDIKKSEEVLLDVFSSKDGLASRCIAEDFQSHFLNSLPDLKDFFITELKIQDLDHFEKQFELFSNFKMGSELFPDMNIIQESQIEMYNNIVSEDEMVNSGLFEMGCEYGYYSMSKPFFNEDYSLALVEFANFCGHGLCGGGRTAIYKNKNGVWAEVKVLNSWIG